MVAVFGFDGRCWARRAEELVEVLSVSKHDDISFGFTMVLANFEPSPDFCVIGQDVFEFGNVVFESNYLRFDCVGNTKN